MYSDLNIIYSDQCIHSDIHSDIHELIWLYMIYFDLFKIFIQIFTKSYLIYIYSHVPDDMHTCIRSIVEFIISRNQVTHHRIVVLVLRSERWIYTPEELSPRAKDPTTTDVVHETQCRRVEQNSSLSDA